MHVRECRSSTLVQQVRAQHFTSSSKGARRACTATEMDESLEDLLLETVEKQPLSRVSVTLSLMALRGFVSQPFCGTDATTAAPRGMGMPGSHQRNLDASLPPLRDLLPGGDPTRVRG